MWIKWTVVVVGACLSYRLNIVAQADNVPAHIECGAVLEVTEENDWFAGTDRHYT